VLVNLRRDGVPAEHRRLFLAGVALMTVVALLIALSIALYLKVFKPAVMITLRAEQAGLQLARYGDVRLNGVLVGQVRGIDQDGDEAVIEVALEPASAETIPANVEATILPTTLFGQKYIALSGPRKPSQTPIEDGAVIPAERVKTSVELNRVLNQLFPLLRTIRPADLNATLNALATALGGRGEQIGRTIDDLDAYLTSMNQHLPALEEDIRLLADVANTYSVATPDVVRILRNATVTSRTVLEKKAELTSFFEDVAGVSDTATRVLGANEQSLIRLGELSRPALRLLDTYAPEYPCLLKGIDRYEDRLAEIFEGNKIKQYVEVASTQRGAYEEEDKPVYGEVGHGPWCLGLPYPPVPIPPQPLRDGTDKDAHQGDSLTPPPPDGFPQAFDPASFSTSSGFAGTASEQAVVSALLAARTGRPADEFSSIATLLYGPVVRGTEVRS
jgi:phospholipid/cholesterol/gamma-HCH transport system substrate-binding protein